MWRCIPRQFSCVFIASENTPKNTLFISTHTHAHNEFYSLRMFFSQFVTCVSFWAFPFDWIYWYCHCLLWQTTAIDYSESLSLDFRKLIVCCAFSSRFCSLATHYCDFVACVFLCVLRKSTAFLLRLMRFMCLVKHSCVYSHIIYYYYYTSVLYSVLNYLHFPSAFYCNNWKLKTEKYYVEKLEEDENVKVPFLRLK